MNIMIIIGIIFYIIFGIFSINCYREDEGCTFYYNYTLETILRICIFILWPLYFIWFTIKYIWDLIVN